MSGEEIKKTGIVFACTLNSARAVATLIKKKCDVNEKDDYGRPAIIVAALMNNHKIVKLLVEAGADINAISPQGETVAYWAERHKNSDMAKLVRSSDNSQSISSFKL